jgi:hypothetical protein
VVHSLISYLCGYRSSHCAGPHSVNGIKLMRGVHIQWTGRPHAFHRMHVWDPLQRVWKLWKLQLKARKKLIISNLTAILGSRDSVVGIATGYGLEGPGIESRWGEIFRTYPDRLRAPPNLLYNGYRVFPGGKGGRGVMLTTHTLLVPRLRKSWAIPPLTLWVLLGLLQGSFFFFFFCNVNFYSTIIFFSGTLHDLMVIFLLMTLSV